MGTTSKHSWSRRDFLKGAAAGTMSVAALGALGGCSPQQSASTASAAAADSGEAGTYDVMQELSTFNRGQNASAKAPTTPEEYIALKGDGVLSAGGGCEQLGIKPADFMLNKPAWLGDAPVVSDIADTEDCDVLVIGAGNAGTVAALRCQEEGANVFLADMQTYDEYDEYACDMACYNSKLFLDKGTPEIDTTEVFNEYMRLSRGHAHQKIVRDYAMRSGEMLDWMVGHIPAEYVEKYAKTSNYKGNDNFNGECCGQRSWPAMTQWRDEESNINMWPFVIRSVHAAFEEAGGTIKWGYQGVVLVQDGDAVTGAVFQDVDGATTRSTRRPWSWRRATSAATPTCASTCPTRCATWPGRTATTAPTPPASGAWAATARASACACGPAARWRAAPAPARPRASTVCRASRSAAHGRASATTASAS